MRTAALLFALSLSVSCQPGSDATVQDPNNPDTMKPGDQPPIKIVPSGFDNKSGARLKTAYAVVRSADGLALSYAPNIYDSALGVSCSRQIAGDGKYRCLPSIMANAYPSSYTPTWFSDASCSSPVFRVQSKDCGTAYNSLRFGMLNQVADGCGATTVFELGKQVEYASVYIKDAMGCRKSRTDEVSSLSVGWTLFEIKRQMDPGDFVEVNLETVIQQ